LRETYEWLGIKCFCADQKKNQMFLCHSIIENIDQLRSSGFMICQVLAYCKTCLSWFRVFQIRLTFHYNMICGYKCEFIASIWMMMIYKCDYLAAFVNAIYKCGYGK